MISNELFNTIKILDGGMGQELLSRGLKSKGSLWSASALLNEAYHQLIIDAHIDFIKAGSDIIVTNNFSARRARMIENNVNGRFDYANKKAGELASKAREVSKADVLIAGSLPAQGNTYVEDLRYIDLIKNDFYDQAICLKPYVDFYYLDVISSIRECEIALQVTNDIKTPSLVGIHIKSDGYLPSGETIDEAVKKIKEYNILGVILSCVSPEIIQKCSDKLSKMNVNFGFKANLWEKNDPLPHTAWIKTPDQLGTNPNEVLGTRKDYTDEMFLEFSKNMLSKGATIIGGCCEITPNHIKKLLELKN